MIKVAWDRVTRDNVLRAFSASILIGAACFAFAADGGTDITVSGWVIDSSCAYTKGRVPHSSQLHRDEWGMLLLIAECHHHATIAAR